MFSSSFNPNKLVEGKFYSTLDGRIYVYEGSENRTGAVNPGQNSEIATIPIYNFKDVMNNQPMSLTKNQMDKWKLEPMPAGYTPPQGPTGGKKKSRRGKRVRKTKTAKKGKK